MKRFIPIVLLIFFLPACSSISLKGKSRHAVPVAVASKLQLPPKGTVFAKTVFEGVVKTSYVLLTIVDEKDSQKIYRLYIGDTGGMQTFPWEVQTVTPGYFFIELPPGRYRIQSISIPVGTTMATEPFDVTFFVKPQKPVYLGTLEVVGTKEKIRFSGIPFIKPGFEYRVSVRDERQDAFARFRQRSPQTKGDPEVHLMKVGQEHNVESFSLKPWKK
jgi:hypothetical protein